MIALFNLNTYLGGGEVLLIRYADYLKSNETDFIIVCTENSYIHQEACLRGFSFYIWPLANDSLIYEDEFSQSSSANVIHKDLTRLSRLRCYTFCLRDFYNIVIISKFHPDTFSACATGVYHPDDFKYLSSFTINKNDILQKNINIFRHLENYKSVIYMNQIGALKSIGRKCEDPSRLQPIPIPLQNFRKLDIVNCDSLNITCISRFVGFKMSAVAHFLKTARMNKKHNFTLIGHGFWTWYIKIYLRFFRVKNCVLLVNVTHHQLQSYIERTNIAFAQGTSALEFSSHGVPVVIAPYSSLVSFLRFKPYYVHDFFGLQDSHLGDEYFEEMNCSHTLTNRIDHFKDNQSTILECNAFSVQNFNSDRVFNNITYVLQSTVLNLSDCFSLLPTPPILKRLIKRLLRK
ncbi:hypothetical protein [Vibrio cyclitrophicus]